MRSLAGQGGNDGNEVSRSTGALPSMEEAQVRRIRCEAANTDERKSPYHADIFPRTSLRTAHTKVYCAEKAEKEIINANQ